ncbi:MAG: hypothetical protein AAGG79_05755 [Pseudomonadota bacterium]
MSEAVHGTALGCALAADQPLRGVLLVGPSGAGKSALASGLIAHCPFQRTGLIADDLVNIDERGWAHAPAGAEGVLLHLAGMGIAEVRSAPPMLMDYVVHLGPVPDSSEIVSKMPAAQHVPVDPEAVDAAKLRLALGSLSSGRTLWCGFEPGPAPRRS